MKQAELDVKNDAGIKYINEDHKAIFNYIEQLQGLAEQPQNYEYAIIILERFITFFLEHTIKEEQLLQQYLPIKIVEEHALLHQRELRYLDDSLKLLKITLSSDNILTVASQLHREFENHIYRYDKNIIKKLIEARR